MRTNNIVEKIHPFKKYLLSRYHTSGTVIYGNYAVSLHMKSLHLLYVALNVS